jgi:hypothetical protein
MHTNPKPLLVVADIATKIPVPVKENIVRIADSNRIFPSIHELKPTGIVLDYDYLGHDAEKILRRITSNPFYSKIKIYCYKSRPHTKVDALLTALGVQHFIYAPVAKQAKHTVTGKLLHYLFDGVAATKLADVG